MLELSVTKSEILKYFRECLLCLYRVKIETVAVEGPDISLKTKVTFTTEC